MNRTGRVALALAALAFGCDGAKREQARQDSIRVADSVRFAAVAADSARRADSMAAAAANAKAPARSKTANTAKQGEIGRDSVRRGPIIAVPIAPDTVKKRPPR